ncbi:MAG TPA: DMT family transporter [Roseiflexaceae bacterium]|nr:DMT family transporter [Roseiflexaceae bacterium]
MIDLRTLLALACTIVLWAAAFVGIRAGLAGYGPAHLALLRFLIASLALGAYAIATRMRLPRQRDLPGIALAGLIGITLYNLALNAGERSVSAGAASLLVNTAPIWTATLATAFLGERLRVWGWLGMSLSFAGAATIALGEREGLGLSWGAGLVLIAALAQSVYFVIQKPLLATYRPVEFATYAIWAGTLGLLPFAPGLAGAISAAPIDATLAVAFLGIGPAALAYATWAAVLARVPAARAASMHYLVPGIAILIGWIWLGEEPRPLSLLGGAIAIAGVVIVTKLGRARTGAGGGNPEGASLIQFVIHSLACRPRK